MIRCVEERAKIDINGNKLGLINHNVQNVKMDMSITGNEDRVWVLYRHYLKVLKNTVVPDLPSKMPNIAISHILKRVKPKELKEKIKQIIRDLKLENFDKKDVGEFMRELAKLAKMIVENGQFCSQKISEADSESSDEEILKINMECSGMSSAFIRKKRTVLWPNHREEERVKDGHLTFNPVKREQRETKKGGDLYASTRNAISFLSFSNVKSRLRARKTIEG